MMLCSNAERANSFDLNAELFIDASVGLPIWFSVQHEINQSDLTVSLHRTPDSVLRIG